MGATRVTLTENDLYWISEWRGQCVTDEAEMAVKERKTFRKLERAAMRLLDANTPTKEPKP